MLRPLVFIFITLCSSQFLFGSPSVIRGSVTGNHTQISFSFPTDYISGNRITYPVYLSSDGSYNISLEIEAPIEGRLIIGDWITPIFIHPNDTLSISLADNGTSFIPQVDGLFAAETVFLGSLDRSKVSDEDAMYAMASMEVDQFKTWLTERYNRDKADYTEYRSVNSFSPEFEVYMNSEIDYNYAFSLLRYRIEYPISNDLVPPLQLPSEYIRRINSVVVNNGAAITSPAYRRFLEEYIDLTREMGQKDQLFLVEENFKVISKTSPLFAQPDVPPIYQAVSKGEVVKFLGDRSDFKSKSRIGGEMSEDYWYRVRLSNGRKGWLLGHTIDKIEKATSQNEKPIKREVTTISKVVTKAIAIYDRLEIFNDPNERKVIRVVGYGMEMDYPHVSTTENMAYEFQGINRIGKFVMVDIQGEIGWVFEQGIKIQRKVIQSTEQRQVVTLAALKDYSKLDRFLTGVPLYYFIAADLNNRMQYARDKKLKSDIENFLNISDVDFINRYIQFHYNELFGTELDFDLNRDNIQLVKLNSSVDANKVISSTFTLDKPVEVYENYVVLPALEDPISTLETRISIADTRRIRINVITDPLSGSVSSLRSYRNQSDGVIAYDQASNEMALVDIDNEVRPLYLTAGADLHINLDANGHLIFNENDKSNVFLNAFYNSFRKRDQSITQRIRTADELEFKTYISSLAKQKLTFIKVSEKKMGLDEEFVKDIIYDINYWMGYQLLRYTQEHPKYDESWSLPKNVKNYYDFLSQIDINPVDRALGANYRSFIQAYKTYVHGLMDNRNKTAKMLIEERFNGYSYYYLSALELYADVFRGDPITSGKDIAQFIQLNPYASLNRSLTSVYNANLPLRAGVAAPYFELKDRNGRQVSQSDLIGKIVVLDFWATWCAPCLEKIRTDRSIWDKYSSEDVVFLYVSLDNSKSTWQRFLNNNSSIKGLHTFPDSQQSAFDSPIARAYKVSAIPAFYIVGKDGNLAYNPFTTLSPTRIRDHIDNLLYPK